MSEPIIDSDTLINSSTEPDGAAAHGRSTTYRNSQRSGPDIIQPGVLITTTFT